ncbi:MAG: hypothetical protein EPN55_06995 [Gammaproteobacteria bacterium]|nr:MAG: hypothetical protein EPN55_06995 [Gammaproteobacteria bacterium]
MYQNIIFDFDGVIVDSNEIRIEGFRTLYAAETGDRLDRFMQYVRGNRGLSRYRKIRYYYEQIRGEQAPNELVERDARRYSQIVAKDVACAPELPGAEAFLAECKRDFRFALVSASDQDELRAICRLRGLDRYFDTILGSPEDKAVNIRNLMQNLGWHRRSTVYVGDSSNDRTAADSVGIDFIGFGKDNFQVGERDHEVVDGFAQLRQMLLDRLNNQGALTRA